MVVEKLEIGKSVEALHEWHKLSLTVTILPGEDPESIHKEAKSLLDRLLPGVDSPSQPPEIEPIDKRIASLIEDINGCTEINHYNTLGVQEGLIAYANTVTGHPELQTAYDLKLKQLQK